MQITAFTDDSLRVLIYLAVSDGRQVSSRGIAKLLQQIKADV